MRFLLSVFWALCLSAKRWLATLFRSLLSFEHLLRKCCIKYTRLVAWSVTNGLKGKPSSLPGIGLELSVVGSFLMVGLGQVLLVLQG